MLFLIKTAIVEPVVVVAVVAVLMEMILVLVVAEV